MYSDVKMWSGFMLLRIGDQWHAFVCKIIKLEVT